jgi:hypothetical protein
MRRLLQKASRDDLMTLICAETSAAPHLVGRNLWHCRTLWQRHCEKPTGPAFGRPDDKLRDEQSILSLRGEMDCFASLITNTD